MHYERATASCSLTAGVRSIHNHLFFTSSSVHKTMSWSLIFRTARASSSITWHHRGPRQTACWNLLSPVSVWHSWKIHGSRARCSNRELLNAERHWGPITHDPRLQPAGAHDTKETALGGFLQAKRWRDGVAEWQHGTFNCQPENRLINFTPSLNWTCVNFCLQSSFFLFVFSVQKRLKQCRRLLHVPPV